MYAGCELISNCIFTWEFTRSTFPRVSKHELWIDFKLYFYVRIHKEYFDELFRVSVVNWFQIVFLRENSQADADRQRWLSGCELISNCIFTWEFTRDRFIINNRSLLWIDFKLYFYVRIHKIKGNSTLENTVVNWFQIVFLRENSQVKKPTLIEWVSCELISNCIFTWEFTSYFVCLSCDT